MCHWPTKGIAMRPLLSLLILLALIAAMGGCDTKNRIVRNPSTTNGYTCGDPWYSYPGCTPPSSWYPPNGWTPPSTWYPPTGWNPPQWWTWPIPPPIVPPSCMVPPCGVPTIAPTNAVTPAADCSEANSLNETTAPIVTGGQGIIWASYKDPNYTVANGGQDLFKSDGHFLVRIKTMTAPSFSDYFYDNSRQCRQEAMPYQVITGTVRLRSLQWSGNTPIVGSSIRSRTFTTGAFCWSAVMDFGNVLTIPTVNSQYALEITDVQWDGWCNYTYQQNSSRTGCPYQAMNINTRTGEPASCIRLQVQWSNTSTSP
jgi:hypothetical protein